MRYAIVSSLAVSVVAVALILTRAGARSGSAGRSMSAAAGAQVAPTPMESTETFGPADAAGWSYSGPPEARTSRGTLVERATKTALTMGETNPQLVDVTLLPVEVALEAAGQGDPRENTDLRGKGKMVYLTRMTGSFVPPHPPAGVTVKPISGFMYTIVDPESGGLLMQGITPGTPLPIPAQ